jgi:hypothetical protein
MCRERSICNATPVLEMMDRGISTYVFPSAPPSSVAVNEEKRCKLRPPESCCLIAVRPVKITGFCTTLSKWGQKVRVRSARHVDPRTNDDQRPTGQESTTKGMGNYGTTQRKRKGYVGSFMITSKFLFVHS